MQLRSTHYQAEVLHQTHSEGYQKGKIRLCRKMIRDEIKTILPFVSFSQRIICSKHTAKILNFQGIFNRFGIVNLLVRNGIY